MNLNKNKTFPKDSQKSSETSWKMKTSMTSWQNMRFMINAIFLNLPAL